MTNSRRGRSASAEDVAKLAGVSRASVSRVFSDQGN
ncbi:MAG: LacI family DNA-binding transcriptional regulator, partial [Gammaproteobacteria bacterium]|nr:LacI family DNA-binding transcriptional regulator [Gammaproteobacteria bacterium]